MKTQTSERIGNKPWELCLFKMVLIKQHFKGKGMIVNAALSIVITDVIAQGQRQHAINLCSDAFKW